MLRNSVVLCDLKGVEKEVCPKMEAHIEGKLHRAFSVFLFDGKKMLIQKRADTKYHTPSLWTNACCSHPRLNEDVVLSGELRTKEELGIDVKLRQLFQFTYYYKFKNDLTEYEYDFVLAGEYSGKVYLDKEEASEYKWIDIDELYKWVGEKPEEFTPWFIICLDRVIKEYFKDSTETMEEKTRQKNIV